MLDTASFTFEGVWPRRSFRATQNPKDRLQCLGKKYTLRVSTVAAAIGTDTSLLSAPSTDSGAMIPLSVSSEVNVVLAHANGFVKELYEPFIENLLQKSRSIKAIYIHDVASQGASGVANASVLGDEYHWSDSALDLLTMIHYLRTTKLMGDEPIIGMGHSMGGCQIAFAALVHPRIFAGLVLIDPVIDAERSHVSVVAALSAHRRPVWPSSAEARAKFSKSPFYQKWHPSVFEKWMEYGIRPTGKGAEVELTTTVAQEVYSFLHFRTLLGHEEHDLDTCAHVLQHLKYIAQPINFIFGEFSDAVLPPARTSLYSRIQQGSQVVFKDCGHLVPMEMPAKTADYCSTYIRTAMDTWQALEAQAASTPRHTTLPDDFKAELKKSAAKVKLSAKL